MNIKVNVYQLLMESIINSVDSIIETPETKVLSSKQEAVTYLESTLPSLVKRIEKEAAVNLECQIDKLVNQ
ncbi:hypothetical protein NRIC_38180 [Enterococcus florum]|uniref:Uncharacterized protein n=1 Tax=Enterococcus florum TaxID=2480627 RepID=A0A4P5PCG9_9ENTE|nr:hypothetical protein [Enterococcus florum]GCF95927.1 hypothetical protein NRIC_38180 [Enterococcus florum]